ncbi:MAG: hypothetical protein ACXABF_12305 [Candidatus Thorarchaeota archaeon]|jgi:hypothetical protein
MSQVTVGQVGQQVMKYWPAILIIVALIAAGAEVRLRVNQHGETLKIIVKKLESREIDKQQWVAIRGLIEDSVAQAGKIKELEKHVTPEAIQKWGEVKNTVQQNRELLWKHLFAEEEEE